MADIRWFRLSAASVVAAQLAFAPAATALAGELLGLYVGGAAGQANVAADNVSFGYGDFREHHSAWKGIAGIHLPLGWGVEANYIDFGDPSASIGPVAADVHVKGTALYAMWYLPIPVVDIYVKAGIAQLRADLRAVNAGAGTCVVGNPGCALFTSSNNRSVAAAGAGAQINLGSLAVRAEYERYNEAAGNPTLLSLGLIWKFL